MTVSDRSPPRFIRDAEDIGSNPTGNPTIAEVVVSRLSRRDVLKRVAAGAALGAVGPVFAGRRVPAAEIPSTLTFQEIEHGIDETHHVAKGYTADVLIRWGDGLAADAAAFDPKALSAADQAKQFGYNCDFIAYMPLPAGSSASDHGLLCVNHEFTSAELMWPGLTEENRLEAMTRDQVDYEFAAHGHSIVEIRKEGGKWTVVRDSRYNRRLSLSTQMRVSGPAAGHDWLRTRADPTGTTVMGTVNNCAGGWTPWGTVLIAEENFNGYFGGDAAKLPQTAAYKRYGISKDSWYAWWKYHDRFNVEKEPNEPNRFGWIVEIDPYDPVSVPVKRTALGRFKHEGGTTILNRDGRVIVYMGDDERFDYVYKFVTARPYDPGDRAANMTLLDEGTLYVAQFTDEGTVRWLPLVHGEGPLTAANGFGSQAEVLIHARMAADALGATPMDRPEDVEASPVTGRVYVIMTNNSRRKLGQTDAANPRFGNMAGHIIELIPPGEGRDADHAATEFAWEHFIIAGNPVWGSTLYGKGTGGNGWFACPDNCAVDPKGRLWIATDQGGSQAAFGIGDGIWAADTTGDGRAVSRFFYRAPRGAEMCGPCFTPDGTTLFVAVQHPAEGEGSTFDAPSTRWPDFADGMPPRPSVVAITKDDGGEIGA